MNTEPIKFIDRPVIEQLQLMYWDAYKDAFGVRPRHADISSWNEDRLHNEIEFCVRQMKLQDDEAANPHDYLQDEE
jgi:hypothetical protein